MLVTVYVAYCWMNVMHIKEPEKIWAEFAEVENLSPEVVEQFKRYGELLLARNADFNLTALKDMTAVTRHHFSDSLALRKFVDLTQPLTIADVGAGAGFPLLPLKILFPHLKIILIEVTRKKQEFLQEIVDALNLTDVEICDIDWRTFLRNTEGHVDYFVSRAAIDEVELCRAFRSNCAYRTAEVIYWTVTLWECDKKAEPYLKRVESYKNHRKDRKLAFFRAE